VNDKLEDSKIEIDYDDKWSVAIDNISMKDEIELPFIFEQPENQIDLSKPLNVNFKP